MLLGASPVALANLDPLWKAFTESTHVAQLHENVQEALAGNPVAINRYASNLMSEALFVRIT